MTSFLTWQPHLWALFMKLYRSAWAIPMAFLMALVLKFFFPNICAKIGTLAPFYDSMWQFTCLPIVFITVVTSVERMITMASLRKINVASLACFFLCTLMAFGLGIGLARLFSISMDLTKPADMQKLILEDMKIPEKTMEESLVVHTENRLYQFVSDSIPENVFSALASGHVAQIIISAILLGIGLKYVSKHMREKFERYMNVAQEAFHGLSAWLLPFLALGLFLDSCLYFARMKDLPALIAGWKYVCVCFAAFFLMSAIAIVVLCHTLRTPFRTMMQELYESIVLVFSTNEVMVAIPMFLKNITLPSARHKQVLSFMMPFSSSIFVFGRIFQYTIITIIIVDMYNVSMDFYHYATFFLIIFFASIPTMMLDQGITTIFRTMGLPMPFAITFFPLVDWIFEPLRAIVTFLLHAASGVWLTNRFFNSPKRMRHKKKIPSETATLPKMPRKNQEQKIVLSVASRQKS